MQPGETLCILRKLLLYFVRVNEEILEVRPSARALGRYGDNVSNRCESLLPAANLRLKSREVLGGHHTLHNELVVFESFEVFAVHAENLHVRVFVLVVQQLHVTPGLIECLERLLHLLFFLCLVNDLANIVTKLVQAQIEQVAQLKCRVCDIERFACHSHQLSPMAVAHGWVSQVSD